ncbi:MAG: hypothetical protein HWE16_02615 [Gammaproteobacteria bacterium]|nr:hypothetical protein [Gammaproteobacteria bacterium]
MKPYKNPYKRGTDEYNQFEREYFQKYKKNPNKEFQSQFSNDELLEELYKQRDEAKRKKAADLYRRQKEGL